MGSEKQHIHLSNFDSDKKKKFIYIIFCSIITQAYDNGLESIGTQLYHTNYIDPTVVAVFKYQSSIINLFFSTTPSRKNIISKTEMSRPWWKIDDKCHFKMDGGNFLYR